MQFNTAYVYSLLTDRLMDIKNVSLGFNQASVFFLILVGNFCFSQNQSQKANVESAIKFEDHRLVEETYLYEYLGNRLDELYAQERKLKEAILAGVSGTFSWNPTHDSSVLSGYQFGQNHKILNSNRSNDGSPSKGLLIVGESNGHRYAAMATNMLAVDVTPKSTLIVKNLIAWLLNDKYQKKDIKVVLAHVPTRKDSRYFPHQSATIRWLNAVYSNKVTIYSDSQCDYDKLDICIDQYSPDLVLLSDMDREKRGGTALVKSFNKIVKEKVPFIFAGYYRGFQPIADPIGKYMGIKGEGHYWKKHRIKNLDVKKVIQGESDVTQVKGLLKRLQFGRFTIDTLKNCKKNYMDCHDPVFANEFRIAADLIRSQMVIMDEKNQSAIHPDTPLMASISLLADKLRERIDYPITMKNIKAWYEAMFADWVINYSRTRNLAQPDLGSYVRDQKYIKKNHQEHYLYPETLNRKRAFSVPFSGQWTTTGWYALPGQKVKLTLNAKSDEMVKVKLNFHRSKTNKVFKKHVYYRPLELEQSRLRLLPGVPLTFTTPYGGPIYLYVGNHDDKKGAVSIDVSAEGVAEHPTILDFDDAKQIELFLEKIHKTSLPHVDLRNAGAEQHLRKDRLLGALNEDTPNIESLLYAISNDHINANYTLAGYKTPNKPLKATLPKDVVEACILLFGESDCFDEELHIRKNIQHANYDQNAQCGIGCAGNPWDSAYPIQPYGWLDNHELGHNLQTRKLNTHYASRANRNQWEKYDSRAGENSNNIFPYYMLWKQHYINQKKSEVIKDHHANQKDLFFVYMSDVLNLRDKSGVRVVVRSDCKVLGKGDKFSGPWNEKRHGARNSYRLTFYLQLILRHHKKKTSTGVIFNNGFHVITLLYLHSRIFDKYSASEALWQLHRDRLGFSEFPFKGHPVYGKRKVGKIPGNDFLLVSLSKLTGEDWRPYFDMFGLHYSDLAKQQVLKAKGKPVDVGMYVVGEDLPGAGLSEGLRYLSLNQASPSLVWPRDGSSPKDCKSLKH